jgi:hypothetical protein
MIGTALPGLAIGPDAGEAEPMDALVEAAHDASELRG